MALRLPFGIIASLLITAWLSSCANLGNRPVTWDNIANTIPSNPTYVMSVNTDMLGDSAVTSLWSKDFTAMLFKGLQLDSLKPDHIVVVSFQYCLYATWPLSSPLQTNSKVATWSTASLNNTVDAHCMTQGDAAMVVSSTQAWVVNNSDGQGSVNNLLAPAMNTKAANVAPFAECMVSCPKMISGALWYNNRYYILQVNHDDGQVRVDIDAYSRNNNRVDLVDSLGRLPISTIDQASARQPFAAIEIPKGTLPKVITFLASVSQNPNLKIFSDSLATTFADAQGTLLAQWTDGQMHITVPFPQPAMEKATAKAVTKVSQSLKWKLHVINKGDSLIIKSNDTDSLSHVDNDTKTPGTHTQTENPSAVAFARLVISRNKLPVQLYFELAPTHARLQIDYKEETQNTADVLKFIKTLVFSAL